MSDTTTSDLTPETPKVPSSAAIRRMAPKLEETEFLVQALLDAHRARVEAERAFEALRKMVGRSLDDLE